MSKLGAQDTVEAVLLEVHHAAWLSANPHVVVKDSLEQDRLLGDAERTLQRRAPDVLDRLRREARIENGEVSRGRVQSEWIEPEPLFWAAWHSLGDGERGAIAAEAVAGFTQHVHEAAGMDPRGLPGDPMARHRHRLHPLLWRALQAAAGATDGRPEVRHELREFERERETLLARRPEWSQSGELPPWDEPPGSLGPFSSR
jgi:hypothetical protein